MAFSEEQLKDRLMMARTEYNQHGKETKKAVCKQLDGIAPSKLSNLENTDNHRKATAEDIALLAEYYGVSADYLLGLTEVPTPKDADITAVCEYMGYSKETIDNLRNIKTQLISTGWTDEIEGYDEDTGHPIFQERIEQSPTLLRVPDEWTEGPEDYTKAEAKQAIDKFFSAEGISEFFSEIAHLQRVLSDQSPFSSGRIEQYAKYSFAEVCMQIAAQAFIREGEDN